MVSADGRGVMEGVSDKGWRPRSAWFRRRARLLVDRRDLVAGREVLDHELAFDGALVRAREVAGDEGWLGGALVPGAGGDAQAAAALHRRAVHGEAAEDQGVAARGRNRHEIAVDPAPADLHRMGGDLALPQAAQMAAGDDLDRELPGADVHQRHPHDEGVEPALDGWPVLVSSDAEVPVGDFQGIAHDV